MGPKLLPSSMTCCANCYNHPHTINGCCAQRTFISPVIVPLGDHILRVLDCIVTTLFGVYLVLWLFELVLWCVGVCICVCVCVCVWVGVWTCGFCDVWVCVCVGVCGCVYVCVFVMCGCVYVWVCVGVCMCWFCNVWVCVCVGFVMCGCVYVWVL